MKANHKILFFYLVLFAPISLCGKTWYINNIGSGDAPTIQAGIDSSTAGDTVLVLSGYYSIETPILVGGSGDQGELTIISEEGPDYTILDGNDSVAFVAIGGDLELLIKGFTFKNYDQAAISIVLCSSDSIVVRGNIFYNIEGSAIVVDMSTNIIIDNNLIYNSKGGIATINGCTSIKINNNTIFCINDVGVRGISLDSYGPYIINNNIVNGCEYGILCISPNIDINCNNSYDNITNYFLPNIPPVIGRNGNLSIDPEYCAENPLTSSNFYLQSDSPCVPNNHPTGMNCGLIGCRPIGCSTTATINSTWGAIKRKVVND